MQFLLACFRGYGDHLTCKLEGLKFCWWTFFRFCQTLALSGHRDAAKSNVHI